MTRRFIVFSLALLSTSPAWSQIVPRIVNGGFEVPAPPPRSYRNLPIGTQFAGWQVIGSAGEVATVSTTFKSQGIDFVSHSGQSWLDLTGTSMRQVGIEQSIKTTPGKRYRLSYFVGNVVDGGAYGRDTTVLVHIDGQPSTTSTNRLGMPGRQTWQRFQHDFEASGSASRVAFSNGDPRGDNSAGLDDVTIEEIDGTLRR